jgi:alkaline phosphatase
MHRNYLHGMRQCAVGLTIAAAILLVSDSAWAAKNVILMIADGSGHNNWLAASLYQAKLGKQVYDRPGWQRFACSTYPLNLSRKPTGNEKQDPKVIYDPVKAWDATVVESKKTGTKSFAGYAYLKTTYTESPGAATALATGRKTYINAINWSNDNRPLRGLSIAEIAKACGKSTGVITTVPWSDATPAGLGGAHNASRDKHARIAREMLGGGWLDVIMGCGNPDFDNNGRPLSASAKRDYQWVGGKDTWTALKQGKRGWKLVESKADFEALTSGPTPPKLVATAQVAKTLQEKRGSLMLWLLGRLITLHPRPFEIPFNQNVPNLATMTKAAINCLDDNPKGFYLMIEGGAVDWANHANEQVRMIEEQADFVKAVEAVVDWVDKRSNWDDTLLILTADHETGMLWGPKSDNVAFEPIEDNGPGRLPGMKHNSHHHTNSLVPLYTRGCGSGRFAQLVKGTDARAAKVWQFSGKYIDNTDVFTVMKEEVSK